MDSLSHFTYIVLKLLALVLFFMCYFVFVCLQWCVGCGPVGLWSVGCGPLLKETMF